MTRNANAAQSGATTTSALIERRRRALGRSYRLFYDEPFRPVKGEGVYLWDVDGRQYLDAYNNVASVGHCHPKVVQALHEQAATLNTHTRYLGDPTVAYAEEFLATFPAELSQVIFTCTGSEANDLAYRLAMAATGARGVIVTSNAYHGVTHACALFSPSLGPHVAPGPEVWTVPPPDPALEAEQQAKKLVDDTRAAIADMRAAGVQPAAFFADTIFASDGILPGAPGMLAPLVDLLRNEGALFVADEVQAGLGRTGDGMWGFERHGIVPDVVTSGKPMGNGHPIGAAVARPELMDAFGQATRYFNTFGGNTVSAAVGRAVLRVVHEEGLVEHARTVGAYLLAGLQGLDDHAAVGGVRGAGLYLSVDIVDADGAPSGERAAEVVNQLRRQGVLINSSGPSYSSLKIRPPLPFDHQHADRLVTELDNILGRLD